MYAHAETYFDKLETQMRKPPQSDKEIFENLFVLEAANNHWGDVERGKKIIQD